MKIVALYDIHGNLPALDAVLKEVEQENPDLILVGGDIVPGPMLQRTLYDLEDAAARIRASGYPQAQDFADNNVLKPGRRQTIAVFESMAEQRVHILNRATFYHTTWIYTARGTMRSAITHSGVPSLYTSIDALLDGIHNFIMNAVKNWSENLISRQTTTCVRTPN